MTKEEYIELKNRKKELYSILNSDLSFMNLQQIVKAKRDIAKINKTLKRYKEYELDI